ncbi:ABC transporter permease [Flagellimonas sp.]|uniref:ABC transporter permease n=1 Tax=Flagellimonas sp. TaxID=2058762 RepID=UPI003F4A50A1
MLLNYFKIAWRTLYKNKISSLINLFGLTLGISVCIVLLIFVDYESSFDTFHERSDKTFRVVQHTQLANKMLHWNTTAYPLAKALRNDFPEIDEVTQIAGPINRTFKVTEASDGKKLFEEPQVLFADPFYPKVFDLEWLAGDSNTALNGTNSVVLTSSLAKKYFGLEEGEYETALGKTILLQSKDPLTVTGVVENPPGNSNHQFKMLIPYEFFRINNPYFSSNWAGNYRGTTYVVLNDVSAENTLEAKIQGWKKKYLSPLDDQRISYFLQPLNEIHNETLYGSSPGSYTLPKKILLIGTGVAIFILLIAIINFVNLVTAQSHSRSKEVGVRKILGGSRKALIHQFLLENALLIFLSALCSVLAVKVILPLLNQKLQILDIQLELGWEHLGLILLISIGTILMAAIYPSLVLSAFRPIRALKEKLQAKQNSGYSLRRLLVTFQFIIVQLFVIASIVLFLQMRHFNGSDLGFASESIAITQVPNSEKLEVFRNELLSDNVVSEVSFGSGPPMAVNGFQLGTNFRLPEQAENEALDAEMKIGDIHYLDFYDLELLAGRGFRKNKKVFDEFIVNETFLKTYNWRPEDALGKKVIINEGEATIVGVVKDFHNNALQSEISPVILLNWKGFLNKAFIKLPPTKSNALEHVKDKWNMLFENSIYKIQFLSDAIAKEYAVERLIFSGFGAFSILAIFLGCLGLLGLMSFIIARKRKEVGIRKVLGASMFENVFFFTKEYVKLLGLAFLISAPLAYGLMNDWLESFTYRIDLTIGMFMTGGLITLLIAVLTCGLQSIKASRINPISILKEE